MVSFITSGYHGNNEITKHWECELGGNPAMDEPLNGHQEVEIYIGGLHYICQESWISF